MSKTLTLGSLFDGSGGFPLAATLNDIYPIWASEIEPFPIRVTTKRFPNMKHYGDINKMSGEGIEPVDIISFGSPCQDLSLAGNRKGLVEGNQSNLFFQAIRLIKEMREATDGKYPRFIIWENVTGAFISNCGDDFYAVIKEICNIKENETNTKWDIPRPDEWAPSGAIVEDNFSLAWRTFDSQYWGVPQRRERIYLVADFGGKCAPKILFESESLSGYSNEGFKTWEDTTKNIAEGIGATDSKLVLNDQGGNVMDITYDYVNTLRAESHNHSPIVLDYHPNDSRIDIKSDNTTIQTLTSRMGTGGNNVPLVMQETYNICGKNSNSMKSDNPESGIYKSNISRTIDTSGLNPSCNQGGTVVIEGNGTRPSHLGDGYKESGVMYTLNTTEEHAVAYINNQNPIYSLGHTTLCCGFDSKVNISIGTDVSDTLLTSGSHGVAYDVRFTLDNSQAERNRVYETNVSRTLDTTVSDPNSNHGGLAIIETEDDINYVVRKLTPTECAKLQGFPEWWCSNLDIKNPTEDDIAFWEDVFNTYNQAINTTTKKSVKNIIKFLKHPHSDTAEYKMWGNGISLPIPYYIFFGIKYWSSVDSDDVKVNLVKESKLFQ